STHPERLAGRRTSRDFCCCGGTNGNRERSPRSRNVHPLCVFSITYKYSLAHSEALQAVQPHLRTSCRHVAQSLLLHAAGDANERWETTCIPRARTWHNVKRQVWIGKK
ncbi:unnamed protein product, partial [Ectocarpus sp. 13 AM-2016]